VVFGTVTLVIATASSLWVLRRSAPKSASVGELFGCILIVVPIAVAIMAPDAELGALAVSRKLVGDDTRPIVIPQADPDRPISFVDFVYGSRSPEYATAVGLESGREVELVGFVTHEGTGQGFRLSRFYISCCAADAIPYSADIFAESKADYPDDTWLWVRGEVAAHDGGYGLKAIKIDEVEEPDPPYL
jgi:uncharacterized repeat protein (TIGR03943 family)